MGKVRDLLALNQEGHQVEVLSGRTHLGRAVGTLYVVHRLDEPLRSRPGDLLLVPAETIARSTPGQPWLAPLCQQRPAAVLIHARGDDPALLARLHSEGNAPGVAVLLIRSSDPWQRLIRAIYHVTLQGAAVDSRNLLEEFLDLAATSGGDYGVVLQRARAELGAPLVFIDRSGAVLAASDPLPPAVPGALAAGVHTRPTARLGARVELRAGGGTTYPAHTVSLGSQLIGYLVLISPSETHPDRHWMVVHHASMALGFMSLESRAAQAAVRQYQRFFLDQIIRGRWSEDDTLQLDAPAFPLQTTVPYRLLLLRGQPAPPGRGSAAPPRPAALVESHLLGLGLRAIAAEAAGDVVALCQAGAGNAPPEGTAWRELGQGLLAALQEQRVWRSAAAGISSAHTGWASAAAAYREAGLALLHGPVASPGERVLLHEALGPYLLLGSFGEQPDAAGLVRRSLGPLLTDPGQRDLLQTLSAFFQANMSVEECARLLFIHANTVRYRLRRVEELTGLSVGRADERFQLELAVRLRPFAERGDA